MTADSHDPTPTERNSLPQNTDTVVIGGGLCGLSTAALIARAGRQVVLLERASELGGRARSTRLGTVHANLGPHAIYASGVAARVLAQLGVRPRGAKAPRSGAFWVDGRLTPLPFGPISTMTSNVIAGHRMEFAQMMTQLTFARPARLMDQTFGEWLGGKPAPIVAFGRALGRLTTYCFAPDDLPAGVVVRQLRRALRGVIYPTGGWQSLVDGVAKAARAAGAAIAVQAAVERVESQGEGWTVGLRDGREIASRTVVFATAPSVVLDLAGSHARELAAFAARCRSTELSCLDLDLAGPPPSPWFAMGLTEPVYFSNHSAVSEFGAGQMIHATRYLSSASGDAADAPGAARASIEALVDAVAPGWRPRVRAERFLPRMTVMHATPLVGLARPRVALEGAPGGFVAGDWAGTDDVLLDAALGSAELAAGRALHYLDGMHRSAAA